MEGKELEQFVVNCLEWVRLNNYRPLVQPKAFIPHAPGWEKPSIGPAISSKELYLLYLVEVYKQSTKDQ